MLVEDVAVKSVKNEGEGTLEPGVLSMNFWDGYLIGILISWLKKNNPQKNWVGNVIP